MKHTYFQSDWDALVKAYSKAKVLKALKRNLECLHESYAECKIRNEKSRKATEIATLYGFMNNGCARLAVLGYAFSNDKAIEDVAFLTIREIFENYAQAAYTYLNNSFDESKDSAKVFESMHRLIRMDWARRLKQFDCDGLNEFTSNLRKLAHGSPFVSSIFDIENMHIDIASDDTNELLKMILLLDIANVINSQYMNNSIIQKKYDKSTKDALEYAMNPDISKEIVKYAVKMHADGLVEAFTIWLQNISELREIRDSMNSVDGALFMEPEQIS